MIRSLFFTASIFLFSTPIFSQSKTWVGINAGANADFFKLHDPGGLLQDKSNTSGHIGFLFEHRLNDLFFLGWGMTFKTYVKDVKYKDTNGFFSSGWSFNSGQLPIYLKVEKFFNDNQFGINFNIGGNFVYNFDHELIDLNIWSNPFTLITNSGTIIEHESLRTANLKMDFFLLQGGGGIQFPIFKKRFKLGLQVYRTVGFSEVVSIEVGYKENGEERPLARYRSKGGYTATAVQLFYPFRKRS